MAITVPLNPGRKGTFATRNLQTVSSFALVPFLRVTDGALARRGPQGKSFPLKGISLTSDSPRVNLLRTRHTTPWIFPEL